MRFFTSTVAAVAIVAKSVKVEERVQKHMSRSSLAHNKRRKAFRTLFFRNSKPMWEEMKNISTDLRASMHDEEQHECDLDVGILECGQDQVCVPSFRSKRGGYCQSILWKHESRELQGIETNPPTMYDTYGADTQTNFTEFCTIEAPTRNCTCANFDLTSYNGEIVCIDTTWCDEYDRTLCGTLELFYNFEAGSSSSYTGCYETAEERLCYTPVIDQSTGNATDCLVTMNGCDCDCELTQIPCNNSETYGGIFISCQNNVISDLCTGFGDLFGNKVDSCGADSLTDIPATVSPTQSPSTTIPTQLPSILTFLEPPTQSPTTLFPSKSPADFPVVETDEPSASPDAKPTTNSLVKPVSITIGGLVVIVAMIIAAFFLNKKWNNAAVTTAGHVTPPNNDVETAEAIPIASSDAATEPPTSQQDHTIKAIAIVEPSDSDRPGMAGIKAKKNVVPTYKDQAQSIIHENPLCTEITSGLAETGGADAIPPQGSPTVPQQYAMTRTPLTSVSAQAQAFPPMSQPSQSKHLPDPPAST
jgi:hypothetical protein